MLKKITLLFIQILSFISPSLTANIAINRFSKPRRFPRSEQEMAIFKRGRQFEFQSGRIANIWGENGNSDQELVLLVHGWESRGTTFYKLIDALIAQNFKVIAWNAPAHGASPGDKTQIFDMAKALQQDMKTHNLAPKAMVGHSMGGVIINLLHKYITLPQNITIISSPTNMRPIFQKLFKKYKISERAIQLVLKQIDTFGEFTLDEISLVNSDLDLTKNILVVHDEDDKEIPFSEFLRLQLLWKNADFHATQGLGHRRILRDTALANIITNHIKTSK